jgi:hypothetical protein
MSQPERENRIDFTLNWKSITTDDAKSMKRKLWTAQELSTVIERVPLEGPELLAQDLHRSENTVSSLSQRIGLRTPRKSYRRKSLSVSLTKATPSEM